MPNQLYRERKDTKEPIHEYLVRTTNVGLAARTLNEILDGKEVPLQRERAAYELWRKLVPSRAAVSVEHRVQEVESIHDVHALLLSTGLPIDVLEHTQPIDIVPEKVIASEEKSEAPAPRDGEA